MLSIGIDFGTTNSSVAVYDGTNTTLLPLDPVAAEARVMRSLIYIERDGNAAFGQRALNRYTQQNTGRAVKYEMHRVGEIEMVYGDIGKMVKDAYALIDVNEPGRLFQSLKRFLSNTSFRATNVFGVEYSIDELLALLARELLFLTKDLTGEPVTNLTVGWPVRFSEDPVAEYLARTRLRNAWRIAGARDVRFIEEPTAAIHHFAHESDIHRRERGLVFDFGGGTLDLSVAAVEGGRVTNLASGGLLLGGDLLDSRIIESQLTPLFGEYARYRGSDLPMPRHIFSKLHSWQTLLELNRPEFMSIIRRARAETDQPEQLGALETLVTKNYGLQFLGAIEAMKVALSDANEASLRLAYDDFSLDYSMSRLTFEAVVRPQVHLARNCVLETIAKAGIEPAGLDFVLTTGGSSLIPTFRAMLHALAPRARIQDSDAFTSVAAGLAVIGATPAAAESVS